MIDLHKQILAYKNSTVPFWNFTFPIYSQEGLVGEMSCLDRGTYMTPGIIGSLVRWRQENMKWFLVHFEATHERTRRWIENDILPVPDRIMFLLYAYERGENKLIGQYGLTHIREDGAESDNGMRGNPGGVKGFMHYAEIALMAWMFGKLGMNTMNLWLLGNNEPTLKWHLSTGMIPGRVLPLYRRQDGPDIKYSTEPGVERSEHLYLEMVIDKKMLVKAHPWILKFYQGMEVL
jgi:hypothetical protein